MLEFAKEESEHRLRLGSSLYAQLACIHLWRGRWAEALESAEEGARLEAAGYAAGAWGVLFLARAYAGQHDLVRAMFAEKRTDLPRASSVNAWGK